MGEIMFHYEYQTDPASFKNIDNQINSVKLKISIYEELCLCCNKWDAIRARQLKVDHGTMEHWRVWGTFPASAD